MNNKIIFITEYFNPPFDEGIKKTAYNFYTQLKDKYHVKVICRYGFDSEEISVVKANKLF